MTITATQTTSALPATTTQTAGAGARRPDEFGPPKIGGAKMPPFFDPYARIESLFRELMMAIRQLGTPPIGPPRGCPHMPIVPPYTPPFDPWPPYERRGLEMGNADVVPGPAPMPEAEPAPHPH